MQVEAHGFAKASACRFKGRGHVPLSPVPSEMRAWPYLACRAVGLCSEDLLVGGKRLPRAGEKAAKQREGKVPGSFLWLERTTAPKDKDHLLVR